MPNILIGQELSDDLFRINAQLRAATLDEYNKTAKTKAQSYTPWLSTFPLLPERQIPNELLRQPTTTRGGLVDDEKYLAAVREFMLPLNGITSNGLADQKHTDWIAESSVTERQALIFQEGRSTLLAAHKTIARTFLELIDFTLPLPGQRNRGFANHAIRGAIFRTIPDEDNKYDVAIDLAHEMGHYALMTLQSVDGIIASDRTKPVYSQIRKQDRPAIQVFHAAVAFAFMQMVLTSMAQDEECQRTGERRAAKYGQTFRRSLECSIESLRAECEFTDVGAQLVNEMIELC